MDILLLWIFLIPLCSSVVILFFKTRFEIVKGVTLGLSLLPLLLLSVNHAHLLGMRYSVAWLPALSINFSLAIDELSLLFMYLSAVIVPFSLLCSRKNDVAHPTLFFSLSLFLQALLLGFFSAQDVALFTVFWEAMLLPLFFIILIWGGVERRNAAITFLVYMIGGSVFMVAGVLALFFLSTVDGGLGTFDLEQLRLIASHSPYAPWILASFLCAFAVKTPMFPFHAWLPSTYYQAPMSGTILLSAVLSKAGIYGIIRICLGVFPELMQQWSVGLIAFAGLGVFYGAFAAWRQYDCKRIVLYSSFSHVNFILLGLFVWQPNAHSGAMLQAINHGITITALFFVAEWLRRRVEPSSFAKGGIGEAFPKLCWMAVFFAFASIALPGTGNFVGEFLIFTGLSSAYPVLTVIMLLAVVASAVYMLRMLRELFFGTQRPVKDTLLDLGPTDMAIGLALAVIILWLGIYPASALNYTQSAAHRIVSAAPERTLPEATSL